MMSKPVTYETREGFSPTMVHTELFKVDCQKEKCALWKMTGRTEQGQCGLIK
jgi:hypothetical protein